MSKNTMIELVVELEKLSDTNIRDKFLELAKSGAFHDYRSKHTCGKMYFIECANWCYRNNMPDGDIEIIKRLEEEIKDGEYDEECTVEDRKLLAKELNDHTCEMNQKDKDFFAIAMGISKTKNQFGKTTYFVNG